MPVIESISLGYKIASFGLELGKAIRNASMASLKGAPYRLISTLTTLEFLEDGMTSDFVQDRTLAIMRDNTPIPPFLYITSGNDVIDGLIIDDNSHTFREYRDGDARFVAPQADILYEKG